MAESYRVAEIFVPGRLPEHTYNPRAELDLERQLSDYVEEAGKILTVHGPTKTGKSVLSKRVIVNPVWVDGQGIDSVRELWRRIGDGLGIYTQYEVNVAQTVSDTGKMGGEVGVPNVALHWFPWVGLGVIRGSAPLAS